MEKLLLQDHSLRENYILAQEQVSQIIQDTGRMTFLLLDMIKMDTNNG